MLEFSCTFVIVHGWPQEPGVDEQRRAKLTIGVKYSACFPPLCCNVLQTQTGVPQESALSPTIMCGAASLMTFLPAHCSVIVQADAQFKLALWLAQR